MSEDGKAPGRAPDDDRSGAIGQTERWTELVRGMLREAEAPGASAALAVDGRMVLAAGIGTRDLAGSMPLPAEAQFYLYSITKMLLAIAAMRLVEQGRLALTTPAQDYLPGLPLATPVTLRQLLTHTAGVPDYGGMPAYFEAVRATPSQPWTTDEFLTRTLARGPVFPPGQGWAYSNIGYLIVRLVLERVTGQPLRDVLREQIFAPLGLRHTFVAETLADTGGLTPGFSAFFPTDGALEDVTARYHPGWVAHGVVIGTAAELARVVEALFAGALLRPASLAEMLASVPVPVTHALFQGPSYGLGLMRDTASPYGVTAGHGGGGPGYSTAAFHCADVAGRRVTSVALVNRDQPELSLRIAFALVRDLATMGFTKR